MNFNSIRYFIFLGIIFVLYYFLPQLLRKVLLLVASFRFYGMWNTKYTLLMAYVIIVSYAVGKVIDKLSSTEKNSKGKPRVLGFGLCLLLLALFIFKYANFTIDVFNHLFKREISSLNILLPVGISFYTFQAIGYVVDIYCGRQKSENLLDYALFISFFPQLVAGPIERSTNILPQLKIKQQFDLEKIKDGITLIILGLVEKVVIAERMSEIVDKVFENYSDTSSLLLIFAVICFSIQIYADFSSYTNIARGSAKMLGIELMENFNAPYMAKSIKEFWRKWHISLSSWFTEYVYIPLGGNRVSKQRHYLNILIVFALSGLWHGARVTFLAWGIMHALAQIFEDYLNYKWNFKLQSNILTYFYVCFTYVFFRATDMNMAVNYIGTVFSNISVDVMSSVRALDITMFDLCVAIALIILVRFKDILFAKADKFVNWINNKNVFVQALCYSALLLTFVFLGKYGSDYVEKPFIYFQF